MLEKLTGDDANSANDVHQIDDYARLSIAVEHTVEAIIITNLDGNIEFVNSAFERITGFSRAEVLNCHISLLQSGQHDPDFYKDMWDVLKRGEIWHGRFVNKKKNNALYEAVATISPVKNQMGEITSFVSVQRDVTNEAQLEQQLRQAEKMEAVGTLAGGVAHDFNNLLMGIQGNISLSLSELDPNSPVFENLKKIEKYVHDGVELTSQLLGFARGGKYEVLMIDINRLLKEQNLLFSRAYKAVTFKDEYEQELWCVEADQNQIEQVILNLYMNALQAMPEGGILATKTENKTIEKDQDKPFRVKAGDYIKIAVSDSGIGMDEKTRRRIFDPFFTTKEMKRGSGMGLASVYGIIKNHSGYINVSSQIGHGTQFEIYLPANRNTPLPKLQTAQEFSSEPKTVLLVDDEEMIIDVGKRMLDKLGYVVLTAKNGEEAVEIYKTHRNKIQLVILDMIMPKVGGGEAFDRLKQINPAIKVILCSGYSIDGQAADILNRGCNAFIQKPFNLETLAQEIGAVLDNDT